MRKTWQTPALDEVSVRSALFGSVQPENSTTDRGPTLGPFGPSGIQLGPQPGPVYGPQPGPQFGPQPGPLMGPTFFALGGPQPGPFAHAPLHGPNLGPNLDGPNLYGPPVLSDVRLKESLRQVGTTVHGLPLYTFSYRGQAEVYEGVMAQDVLAVRPDAVVIGEDGYYKVDYAKLGVPFRRVH